VPWALKLKKTGLMTSMSSKNWEEQIILEESKTGHLKASI
jgi:hypothetical protein